MTNEQLDTLAEQVLRGDVDLDALPEEQVDAVIMRTYEYASEMVDDPIDGEAFQKMVDALEPSYNEILSEGAEEFRKAIEEAEARGSVFCSTNTFMLQ